MLDEEGREIIARHRIRYDYLVVAIGAVSNDFGVARRARALPVSGEPRPGRPLPPAPAQPLHPRRPRHGGRRRADAGGRERGNRGARGHHRRRRHRGRAGGRALQRRRRAAALRPGGFRREPPQGDADRGRAAPAAGAAGEAGGGGARRAGGAGRAGADRHPGHRGERRGGADRRRHAGTGPPAGLGGRRCAATPSCRTSPGWRPTATTSSWCTPPCRPRATRAFSPWATAAPCPQPGSDRPVPPRAQAAHQMATTVFRNLRHLVRGETAGGLRLPRPGLAGLAQPLFHRRQPDGQPDRRPHGGRGAAGAAGLRFALPHAPAGDPRLAARAWR